MAMQPTGPATPPSGADPAADPSMEDILASIRRILNEDEAPKPAPDPHEPSPPPDSGVLVLDSSMMVPEPPRDPPLREIPQPKSDSQPKSSAERPAILEHPVLPEPEPVALRAPPPLQPSAPQPPASQPSAPPPATATAPPTMMPSSPSNSLLVAPEAAAAAGASVDALRRTLASERNAAVQRGGPTLEDLVRMEIRPLLKDWLDSHLPPLVERLVQAEIERVVGRMAP